VIGEDTTSNLEMLKIPTSERINLLKDELFHRSAGAIITTMLPSSSIRCVAHKSQSSTNREPLTLLLFNETKVVIIARRNYARIS
jgi:hypothetical protein